MISSRFARWNSAFIAIGLLILFFWLDPSGRASGWQRFFGRFHSAYVHVPIGFLIFGLVLSILKSIGWLKENDNIINIVLVLTSWAGLKTVAVGSWLGQMGGYPPDILFLHKIFGYGVTLFAAILVVVRLEYDRPIFVYGIWSILLASMVIGSDLGGRMTHGDGYVTEYAPEFVQDLLNHPDPMASRFYLSQPDSTTVYDGIVAPIFADKCTSCHGPDRGKGRLRLHSAEAIQSHDGDDPLLVSGLPMESLLIQRVSLPFGHEDQMPPPLDAKPISHSDVELLKWWIAEGASFEATIAAVSIPAPILTILEAYGLDEIRRGIFALDTSAADSSAVAELREAGAHITPLAIDEPYLDVRCTTNCTEEPSFTVLSEQIAWLDLSGSDVTDEDLTVLMGLPNLTRLNLSNMTITGAGLASMAGLEYLEYLNLYGSDVTDDAVDHIGAIQSLKTIYLWQSGITQEGAERLSALLPNAEIDTGR